MTLDDLLNKNPVIVLALALLLFIWLGVQLAPTIKKVVEAALAKTRRAKDEDEEPEPDPMDQLRDLVVESQQAIKALVITLQLSIETTSQRDARIANLADSVADQTKALGELARAISQLALTGNQQSTQLAQQSTQLAELTGRLGYSNQLGEDTRADLTKAVQAVDDNKQTIEEQTRRITELKEQVEKLEKDVREDFLPTLHAIRTALDGLATKTDVTQIGHISDTVKFLETEMKALIATMTIPPKLAEPPAVPPAPAVQLPDVKADEPPKDKPNEPSISN